ncbi:MAG: hypothetical protein NVS2B8_03160 [Vulcanimicrobiaceae bacterium]
MNAHLDAACRAVEQAAPQPKPRRYTLRWTLALVASDLVTLAFSALSGIAISERLHRHAVVVPSYVTAGVIVALQLLIFFRLDLYRRTFAVQLRDEIYNMAAALTIGALPSLLFFTIWPGLSTSRLTILATLVVSIPVVGGVRAVLYELLDVVRLQQPRRIAIVGAVGRLDVAARSLAHAAEAQVLRIPVDDVDTSLEAMRGCAPYDPARVAWFSQALAWHCDVLVLTETLPPWSMPTLLRVAAKANVKIAFAPPRFLVHAYGMKLEVDGEQTLIVPTQLRACTKTAQGLKRIIDVSVSVVALTIIVPILALCALAIVAESRGPVFYRQKRVGLGGRTFEIIKLRSMQADAEATCGPVWASQDDPRVTRVGRWLRRLSLDELPQFFNVLHGDMSIVGPRPERPEFVEQFRHALERYDERHLVRPGITGWSQIQLRRTLLPTSAGIKLSYDLFYLEQWSLFLDAYIACKTAVEFLFHEAA